MHASNLVACENCHDLNLKPQASLAHARRVMVGLGVLVSIVVQGGSGRAGFSRHVNVKLLNDMYCTVLGTNTQA